MAAEFERLKPEHPYYAAVGRVAKEWALVEHTIDQTIWTLANAEPARGACITSQLTGLLPRFRCLLALAELCGASSNTTKALNGLSQDSFGLGTQRNRVVHDAVLAEKESKIAVEFTITADKKLNASFKPASIAKANDLADKIRAYDVRCFEVLKVLLAETSSSRG